MLAQILKQLVQVTSSKSQKLQHEHEHDQVGVLAVSEVDKTGVAIPELEKLHFE